MDEVASLLYQKASEIYRTSDGRRKVPAEIRAAQRARHLLKHMARLQGRQQQHFNAERQHKVQQLRQLYERHRANKDYIPAVDGEEREHALRAKVRLVCEWIKNRRAELRKEHLERFLQAPIHIRAQRLRLLKRSRRPAPTGGFGQARGADALDLVHEELKKIFNRPRLIDRVGTDRLRAALANGEFSPRSSVGGDKLLQLWESALAPRPADDVAGALFAQLLLPFTEAELSRGLQECNKMSAPGPDGVTTPMLHHAWFANDDDDDDEDNDDHIPTNQAFRNWLVSRANELLTKERPDTTARVHFIAKGNDLFPRPGRARPVGLTNMIPRFLSGLFCYRLSRVLDRLPNLLTAGTTGFLPSTGTDVAIEGLSNWVYWRQRQGCKKTAVIYSDVKSAFDTVPFCAIEFGLRRLGLPAPIVQLILSTTTSVKSVTSTVDEMETPAVHRRMGVVQGDGLSPISFAIAVDPLMRVLRSFLNEGRAFARLNVNHCLRSPAFIFADDLTVAVDSVDRAQAVLDLLASARYVLGVCFAPRKSAVHASLALKREATAHAFGLYQDGDVDVKDLHEPTRVLGAHLVLEKPHPRITRDKKPLIKAQGKAKNTLWWVYHKCQGMLDMSIFLLARVYIPTLEYSLKHLDGIRLESAMARFDGQVSKVLSTVTGNRSITPKIPEALFGVWRSKPLWIMSRASMVYRQVNCDPRSTHAAAIMHQLQQLPAATNRYSELKSTLADLNLQFKSGLYREFRQWSPWQRLLGRGGESLYFPHLLWLPPGASASQQQWEGNDFLVAFKHKRAGVAALCDVTGSVRAALMLATPAYSATSATGLVTFALAALVFTLFKAGVVERGRRGVRPAATCLDLFVPPKSDLVSFSRWSEKTRSHKLRQRDAVWLGLLDFVVSALRVSVRARALTKRWADCGCPAQKAEILGFCVPRRRHVFRARLPRFEQLSQPLVVYEAVRVDDPQLPIRWIPVVGDLRSKIKQVLRARAYDEWRSGQHQGFFAKAGHVHPAVMTAVDHGDNKLAGFVLGAVSNALPTRAVQSIPFGQPNADDGWVDDMDALLQEQRRLRREHIACPHCNDRVDTLLHAFERCPFHFVAGQHGDETLAAQQCTAFANFVSSWIAQRNGRPVTPQVIRLQLWEPDRANLFNEPHPDCLFANGDERTDPLGALFGVFPTGMLWRACRHWLTLAKLGGVEGAAQFTVDRGTIKELYRDSILFLQRFTFQHWQRRLQLYADYREQHPR